MTSPRLNRLTGDPLHLCYEYYLRDVWVDRGGRPILNSIHVVESHPGYLVFDSVLRDRETSSTFRSNPNLFLIPHFRIHKLRRTCNGHQSLHKPSPSTGPTNPDPDSQPWNSEYSPFNSKAASHIPKKNVSRPPTRFQNLLQILPTILMRRLMILQLLLQIRDLPRSLGALARESFVHRVDGDVDEPARAIIRIWIYIA